MDWSAPGTYATPIAFLLLPLANKFFGWCGGKIRGFFQRRLPEGKAKSVLLYDLHTASRAKESGVRHR